LLISQPQLNTNSPSSYLAHLRVPKCGDGRIVGVGSSRRNRKGQREDHVARQVTTTTLCVLAQLATPPPHTLCTLPQEVHPMHLHTPAPNVDEPTLHYAHILSHIQLSQAPMTLLNYFSIFFNLFYHSQCYSPSSHLQLTHNTCQPSHLLSSHFQYFFDHF
jgi:hypothetical protein